MHECIKGFPVGHQYESDNKALTPQTFDYGVQIEFAPGKRDEFFRDPDIKSTYHSITSTISETMGDTLAFELSRDLNEMTDLGPSLTEEEKVDIMRNVTDNTLDDADIEMKDLTGILQQTYPDSGILSAKLSHLSSDNVCGLPKPADIMNASLKDNTFTMPQNTVAQNFGLGK